MAATVTFLITAFGSASIFLTKNISKKFMDSMLSISAGIMIASAFFSLLNPAIISAENLKLKPWMVTSLGFLLGLLVLYLGDAYNKKRASKSFNNLILSMTLHNIPEGMAIGVAFGSAFCGINEISVISALSLAIGIGIQNFPEGAAISFPLYREGYSKRKAFLIGALSAGTEPIGAIFGALLVMKIQFIMPYLLAFAAGAMMYVIATELIPESMNNEKKELMALYFGIGFIIMMILDISLG